MNRRRGFTLIELLIVVAIIAVLLTIIAPALQSARQMASAAVCQGNQKVLIEAWIEYHMANKGHLVGGCNYTHNWSRDRWVEPPKYEPVYAGDPADQSQYASSSDVTQTYRENGLMGGKLWPYVENLKAYHCPADNRINDPASHNLYQTYAITGTMKGEEVNHWNDNVSAYMKDSAIKFAEEKLVFVEEGVKNQWRNAGSWMMRVDHTQLYNYSAYGWQDPLAIFHSGRSTFAFADGHAKLRVFIDDFTFEFSEEGKSKQAYPPAGQTTDISWLGQGYGGLPR